MDRSLKERVIGASVLVGLAVWLIPWVLDGPVQDAEVGAAQVPAAERSAPLRTQTIRLDGQPNSSTQAGATDIPGRPVPQGPEEVPEGTLDVSVAPQPDAPAASGATSSTTAPAQSGPGWLVQVGSFGSEENARRQADRIADAGYTARLYPHSAGGGVMYRVRVGPEPSREGAEEIASSLRDQQFVAQVVSSD